ILPLDLLVGNARIIRKSAFGCGAKFIENFAGRPEREPMRPAEGGGDVLNDPPILPGFSGTFYRLIDLDDAPFRRGYDSLILFLQGAGQDDIRVARGIVHKEVDCDVKLELFEHFAHEIVIWQRYNRIETDR